MTRLALADLDALAAVADHRSFRRAAAILGVSPSALSHTVATAERRLGVRLFNRTTRSVSLTEAGEQFLGRVRPALDDIAGAVDSVGRFRDTPAGVLRLNTSEDGASRILPLVLGYMAAYPDMHVQIATDGKFVDIVAGGFDAGVRLGESVPQDMVALPLGLDEALIIVAAPAYLAARGAPQAPADLANHECLRARLPSGAVLKWELERRGEELRIDPPGRLILGTPALTMRAALAGAGLAYVSARGMAAEHIVAGRLVQVLADWTPPFPGLCLYYPRQRLPTAGLRAFIDWFQAHKREVIAQA